jgi:hypothetical protein
MDASTPTSELDDWLHSTFHYVGVKPVDCRVQSLIFLIDHGVTDAVLDSLFKITVTRTLRWKIGYRHRVI